LCFHEQIDEKLQGATSVAWFIKTVKSRSISVVTVKSGSIFKNKLIFDQFHWVTDQFLSILKTNRILVFQSLLRGSYRFTAVNRGGLTL
jgi:hypothetical protein